MVWSHSEGEGALQEFRTWVPRIVNAPLPIQRIGRVTKDCSLQSASSSPLGWVASVYFLGSPSLCQSPIGFPSPGRKVAVFAGVGCPQMP